jgi:hypothetical protein
MSVNTEPKIAVIHGDWLILNNYMNMLHASVRDFYTPVRVGTNIRGLRFAGAVILADVDYNYPETKEWLMGSLKPALLSAYGLRLGALL